MKGKASGKVVYRKEGEKRGKGEKGGKKQEG